ncbi:MAG: aspartate aminotransferase family protein [Bacteroidota bacterium]
MPNLRQLFLSHLAPTSEFPLLLEVERAAGVHLYDPQGKAYIDLIAGIGVSSLGHCHPKVVEAVKTQVDRYLHTMVYGEYVLSPQVELASLLAKSLPDPLDSVYFVNSGSEATEGAMKLAKRFTGRSQLISCYQSYHGSTQGSASLMSDDFFTQAYRPLLPGIEHIEYNCSFCLQKITEKTAGVIMETVQAEWGIRPPKDDYLQQVRKRCDEVGALLIFDEIQAGYGRTGSLFAFEQYDVVPDVLLLAKGMGGGMPIGAFVASQALMKVFSVNPLLGHITTFGGHPVSCAAALATLKHLLETDLIAQVKPKADLIRSLLQHPAIIDIRNAGLMMAVELKDFDFVQRVIQYCLKQGLIVDWFLFNDRSIRIAPPLIIEEVEIRQACRILLEGIDRAAQNS